jgi:hypothetical protein
MPVPNSTVEDCLRKCLTAEGYALSPRRAMGEQGVDILATKGSESIHIEVIGYKAAGAMRAKDFFEAFFKSVARLDLGAKRCVIAQAANAKVGLPARAAQRRTAWLRIGEAFPELELWFVDTDTGRYERSTWKEWAQSR